LRDASDCGYDGAVRHTSLAQTSCPVARTLDVVGEWWTMLIVRDAFLGSRRFEDFRSLGIADNILSVRLKRLVQEGVLEKRQYQERPARFEYVLTEKGGDLVLVLGALASWGLKWTPGPNQNRMRHLACGHQVTVRGYCEDCGQPLSADEVQIVHLAAAPPAPAAALTGG
jgi:DNA-binding HxlR family transcriptional regulator